MATVTKLKAAVNNKNLPILGDDGNLYNYYVGRWRNVISELGYTPTNSELTALEAFVLNGINDGWIDRVKYFMPFIGLETTPLTGMVPLIDQVADYELAEESVDTELFRYNNGKIMGIGGRDDNTGKQATLPVTTRDFGLSQCFSAFIDCRYENTDLEFNIDGTIISAYDITDNSINIAVRKGSQNSTSLYYILNNGTITETISAGVVTSEDVPQEIGAFWSVYDKNNELLRSRGSLWKGNTSLRGYGTSTFTYPTAISSSTYQFKVGANAVRPLKLKVNVVGIIDPTITSSELLSFNKAVFILTAALGR